mgnify:CR=1 FL=1
MKKMKLTMKELWMIEAIVSNEYGDNNYNLPSYELSYEDAHADTLVWSSILDENGAKHGTKVTGKGISAVVSSLNKKGFARSKGKGNDSTVYVTREGWSVYQEVMKELEG